MAPAPNTERHWSCPKGLRAVLGWGLQLCAARRKISAGLARKLLRAAGLALLPPPLGTCGSPVFPAAGCLRPYTFTAHVKQHPLLLAALLRAEAPDPPPPAGVRLTDSPPAACPEPSPPSLPAQRAASPNSRQSLLPGCAPLHPCIHPPQHPPLPACSAPPSPSLPPSAE